MAAYFVFQTLFCITFTASSVGEFVLPAEFLDDLRDFNSNVLQSCDCGDIHENITKLFVDGRISSATYKGLDPQVLREETSGNFTERIFKPRREVLAELVNKSHKAVQEYDWSKPIESVSFKKASDFDIYNSPSETEPTARRFSRPVNFGFSVVHVPVNVHVGEKTVEYDTLRELEWTEKLDEAFKSVEETTRKNTSREDLMWQYFGSYKGFVRHYPGSRWDLPPYGVDLYDSRRRPWYSRASTPVKEVLIMIDTSGSTEGQTIYLTTLTVEKIMLTLGEDDFVQVANFSSKQRMESMNDEARLGPECFPDFVQATRFNKRILLDYVHKLNKPGSSHGQANYKVALEYAFKSFERFEKEAGQQGKGMGTNCSRIIIILTDGGIEKPSTLIYDHDPNRNKYRIFTFAIGQAPTPLDAAKWLACQTRGNFSRINSIGTIDAGVEQYTNRLSLALTRNSLEPTILLSSIYRDDWGLGMLTTLTKPVFNISKSGERLRLLGVMCVDIALDELDKFIPYRELGPLSYTTVLNHNGFVVKHPLLQLQDWWHVEPPSLDMLDVEVVREEETLEVIAEMRNHILEGRRRQRSVEGVGTLLKNGDFFGYFINHTMEYYTEPIEVTAYGLAMVQPTIVGKVLNVTERPTTAEQDLGYLKDSKFDVAISKWRYCDRVFHITNQSLVFDSLVVDLIYADESCDEAMVNHLLWDASIARSANLTELVMENNVEAVSLTTAGGLTISYPQHYYHPEEVSTFRFGNHYSDPATKRAFSRRDLFMYSAEASSAPQPPDVNSTITIYKAIADKEDVDIKGPYIFGVLGITMHSSVLGDVMGKVEGNENGSLCASAEMSCFLLDEGGFILYESNPVEDMNHVGMWLGSVDSSLMLALYDGSGSIIYRRHKFYDYQGTCIYDWTTESTASASRIPSLYNMGELFVTQALSALALLYSSIINYGSGVEAKIRPLEYGEKYRVCTMVSYQYFYDDEVGRAAHSNRTIEYNSDGCIRSGVAVRIEQTNLLLVIATNPTEPCDKIEALPHDPVEIPYEDYTSANTSVCKRHLRKREPPGQCLNTHQEGSACEGCKGTAVSVVVLLGAFGISQFIQ